MTLNEAIERYTSNAEYERIHGNLQGCLDFRQLAEWLKGYKRLLEQEPCNTDTCKVAKAYMNEWDKPNNSDAISREKAKQFLYERLDRLNDNELYDIFSRIIDDMYNELPSITPQSKTGHWIRQDNTKKPLYGWYFCSECNSVIGDKPKFCSNCGAKMEDKE